MAAEKENSSSLILSAGRSVAQNACLSPLVAASDPGFECVEDHKYFDLLITINLRPHGELKLVVATWETQMEQVHWPV